MTNDTHSLEVVTETNAAGMANLARLPNSGNVALVGRSGADWTCGVCRAMVLRHVKPGAFGTKTVVACGACGALNKIP